MILRKADKGFNLTKFAEDYKYENTIVDSQVYYFQTGEENIGLETSPGPSPITVNYVQVPGFEAIITIIALAAVVLIFKYKKKDENK